MDEGALAGGIERTERVGGKGDTIGAGPSPGVEAGAGRRWSAEVPSKHAVIPWMVEYAAYLLNRFEVGHDGKTAYERMKGKTAKCLGLEFGEGVHWKTSPSGGALGTWGVPRGTWEVRGDHSL